VARGYPTSERTCTHADSTRKLALELVKEYPDAWIECKDDDGKLVHLIEPGFKFAPEAHRSKPIPGEQSLFEGDAS
jgi:hypothetical protein